MNPQPAAAPPRPSIGPDKTPEGLLDARLRELQAVLADATYAIHDLVGRLAPVLPHDFGQRPVSPPPQPQDPPPASPLATDLSDLAGQGHVLVEMLRGICAAVDL